MVPEADAVIIGAGAFGLSTAFHLAALGLKRVVVVEQFAPASQTSPRAAGLFKLIQADETRTRLARLSVGKVTLFEEETGRPLPVVRSGSLLAARTPEHEELIREEVERSQRWGVDLDLVDAAEAQRSAPFLESTGIRIACYTPGDVYIEEPSFLLQAYLEAATRLGVTVVPDTMATGIRLSGSEVVGVVTGAGEISTPVVVDAAGAWARIVGQMAGSRVPVVPVRHQLFITEPIGGVEPDQPIVRIGDTAVYLRPARGGLMLGGFERNPLPVDLRAEGRVFSIDDVPLDLSVLEALATTVHQQVPLLRDAALSEHRGGLFTMTPDGQLIVGPVPDVRGFWTATGCNGSGFSLSPAIGQVLAEWITTGTPSIEMSALHPGRFARVPLDEERLRAAAVWQYTHYYEPDPGGQGDLE